MITYTIKCVQSNVKIQPHQVVCNSRFSCNIYICSSCKCAARIIDPVDHLVLFVSFYGYDIHGVLAVLHHCYLRTNYFLVDHVTLHHGCVTTKNFQYLNYLSVIVGGLGCSYVMVISLKMSSMRSLTDYGNEIVSVSFDVPVSVIIVIVMILVIDAILVSNVVVSGSFDVPVMEILVIVLILVVDAVLV